MRPTAPSSLLRWEKWAAWEGRLMLALALLAGVRVLVFSLAFPFFSNVDEHRHFDVVLKYARGYLPSPGPDPYEPETARLLGRFGSPEYLRDRFAPRQPERYEIDAG